MGRHIEDYGLIGDGETAALVGRDGAIDWLCWPRFDSDACLSALLGTQEHGRWRIAPAAPARSTRRYQDDTLVLETDFETGDGATVRFTDFMPIRDGASALVRIVEGVRGTAQMRLEFNPRFDYGSIPPWIENEDGAAVARAGPNLIVLRAPVPLDIRRHEVVADFSVSEGERHAFTLAYGDSFQPPPGPLDAGRCLAETQSYWRDWIGRFDRKTDWPGAVRRSLITLKAMIHRPTGGIVAAPTTSLPELPGGAMNWDYRYCWLRDATFSLSALINAGFEEEAVAWRDWLLRAVAGAPERIRTMYRADGSRRLEEWTADWLPGFRWSPPVRIANDAVAQLQLDIYGELLDTLHLAAKAGMGRSAHGIELEERVVLHLETIWRQPDRGMWEARSKPRHYVYSKVLCWVALDRFIDGRATAKAAGGDLLERMKRLRREMHEEICAQGFDRGLGSFVSYYGGQEFDASLLLLPIVGFLPVSDERIANTITTLERVLLDDGLVRRHPRGPGPDEGAFLACSCWLAQCQALQGREQDARRTFERVLAVGNDLGLFAEEYDTVTRRLAGNFPQALTHLAIVQTGLALCGPVLSRGASRTE